MNNAKASTAENSTKKRFHEHVLLGGMILLASFVASGCASTQLTMTTGLMPLDNSAVSKKLAGSKCSTVMIIPPSGTARGVFEPKMVIFEREFLRQDINVISPAITGRVVLESVSANSDKNETASALSDMERALVMAQNTGADLILQVGMYAWTPERDTRFFAAKKDRDYFFEEMSQNDSRKWKGPMIKFASPRLLFSGKVVNVENGEVLASLEIEMPANFRMPEDYIASYKISGQNVNMVAGTETNFKYIGWAYNPKTMLTSFFFPWYEESQELAEAAMISYIAEKIRTAVQ